MVDLEAKVVLTEHISELENRLRRNEMELIQVGQDKSLLADDVAELQNQVSVTTHKVTALTNQNQKLALDIEKHKRDLATMQGFSSVLDQVETNGQNYLNLMKDMRKYIQVHQE